MPRCMFNCDFHWEYASRIFHREIHDEIYNTSQIFVMKLHQNLQQCNVQGVTHFI